MFNNYVRGLASAFPDFIPPVRILEKRSESNDLLIRFRLILRDLHFLLPALPDVRLISDCRLPSIPYDRLFQDRLVLQYLLCPVFLSDVLDQEKKIFIFAVLIDHSIKAAYGLQHGPKLTFAETFFFQINELELDPALLEKALRFLRIKK